MLQRNENGDSWLSGQVRACVTERMCAVSNELIGAVSWCGHSLWVM